MSQDAKVERFTSARKALMAIEDNITTIQKIFEQTEDRIEADKIYKMLCKEAWVTNYAQINTIWEMSEFKWDD